MLFNFYAIIYNIQGLSISKFMFIPNNIDILSHSKSILKACPLFLKEKCVSWIFCLKYFEKKFDLQLCFFFPLFPKHLFSPELPHTACLIKTSCFEKITVGIIKTMLMMLLLVQMSKAQREVSQQIKHK